MICNKSTKFEVGLSAVVPVSVFGNIDPPKAIPWNNDTFRRIRPYFLLNNYFPFISTYLYLYRMKTVGADNLDKTYITTLREIERLYATMSKPIRIRIERWITKLNGVGRTYEWRKNRNIYAKLLLNMIIVKNLTAPFNAPPPDEPLPPIPVYIVNKSYKDLMGTHESVFWRDVYEHLENSINLDRDINISKHSSPSANDSISNVSQVSNNENIQNGKSDPFFITEIRRLNNIISQQQTRITSLETQLLQMESQANNRAVSSTNQFKKSTAVNTDQSQYIQTPQTALYDQRGSVNGANSMEIRGDSRFDRNQNVIDSRETINSRTSASKSYVESDSFRKSFADEDKYSLRKSQSSIHDTNLGRDSNMSINAASLDHVSDSRLSFSDVRAEHLSTDEDFLSYIHNFQRELKSLQEPDSPVTYRRK